VIGIYISVPFCAQKCTFCNFASGVSRPELIQEYLLALGAELAAAECSAGPDTLYVGGGTPSLLDPEGLDPIVRRLPATEWREATIEASPGTVTEERAALWRRLGFDRVSLGVQSFVEREIRAAGRKHSAEGVADEVAWLRRAGFERISVDLIAGLPHQTRQSWRESLGWVERLDPPHVSIYMLETDGDSRLGREIGTGGDRYGAREIPGDDEIAEMYLEAVERLARGGWRRYEISNFARSGFESLHNLKYWRGEPYLGLGADAHSYDLKCRWWNVATAREYVDRFRAGLPPVEGSEVVSERQRLEEHFFLGLRETAGIQPVAEEWRHFGAPIRRLREDGLLDDTGGRLRLTDRGMLLSNEVFQEFLGRA